MADNREVLNQLKKASAPWYTYVQRNGLGDPTTWNRHVAQHPEIPPEILKAKQSADEVERLEFQQKNARQTTEEKNDNKNKGTNTALGNVAGLGVGLGFGLASLLNQPQRLEDDPNYRAIIDKKKEEWLKKNEGKTFDSKEGLDYQYGSLTDPNAKTLAEEAEEEFTKKHTKLATKYKKNREKVHKNQKDDVELKALDLRIKQHTDARIKALGPNATEADKERLRKQVEDHEHDKFVRRFETKAKAYSSSNTKIQEAIKRKERKEIQDELNKRKQNVNYVEDKIHRPAPEITQEQATARLETASSQAPSIPPTTLVTPSGQPIAMPPPQPTQTEEQTTPSGLILPPARNIRQTPPNVGFNSQPIVQSETQSAPEVTPPSSPPPPPASPPPQRRRDSNGNNIQVPNRAKKLIGNLVKKGLTRAGALVGGGISWTGIATIGGVIAAIVIIILLLILLFTMFCDRSNPLGFVTNLAGFCNTIQQPDEQIGEQTIPGLVLRLSGPEQSPNNQPVTYTVSISYNPPDNTIPIESITIYHDVPRGMAFESSTGFYVFDPESNQVTWSLENVQNQPGFSFVLKPVSANTTVRNIKVYATTQIAPPPDGGGGAGNGICQEGSGFCSVSYLRKFFPSDQAAMNASMICQKESGSNPGAKNNACLTGKTLDYSIGLFQVNLIVHCRGAFSNYSSNPVSCTIGDEEALRICETRLKQPDENIKEALRISGNGTNWNPWSAASVCGIVN